MNKDNHTCDNLRFGFNCSCWKNALEPYGAVLTDDGRIARNGKVLPVRVVSKGNKLQIVSSESGRLLASGPAKPETLTRFVEAFWFWKPINSPWHVS